MHRVPWQDAASGEYVGYFQLERLSPPPPRAPAPAVAPVVPVMGTVAIPIVTGTAVAEPKPPTRSIAEPVTRIGQQVTLKELSPPPAAPVGPAPTGIGFTSQAPNEHTLSWNGNGATRFSVLRRSGENWITIGSELTRPVAHDYTFVPPGTVYEITGYHSDGREGRAQFTATNPTQPVAYDLIQYVPFFTPGYGVEIAGRPPRGDARREQCRGHHRAAAFATIRRGPAGNAG